MPNFDRRNFLKGSAAAGLGLTFGGLGAAGAQSTAGPAAETAAAHPLPAGYKPAVAAPLETVRIGYVGVGKQGTSHVRNLLRIEGAELVAVCDIHPERAANVQALAEKADRRKPEVYTGGPDDWKRLCERDDLDLVYTATPWNLHAPICAFAMEHGKHAATEIPLALTVEDCWRLVETSERTGRYCMMMENCNYDRAEMMVLNMVRQGLLGELLHGECAYNHDLRSVKLGPDHEGDWRWKFSIEPTGNLYPTHGLGPLAWYLDIGHGDQFDYLVSMSSPARGLDLWAKEHLPESDPRRKVDFQAGDINTSLIKLKSGRTIYLVHDCNTPRPYTRINMIQGTRGIFSGYPDRVHIEGRSPTHEWEEIAEYMKQYEHPLWKARGASSRGAGHGGMDFLEDYRLVRALRKGVEPDFNVYDGASWSVIVELTMRSLNDRSRPQDFPDFTRGLWKTRKPVEIAED